MTAIWYCTDTDLTSLVAGGWIGAVPCTGDAPECYGKQRMYGSIGWAISMFSMGVALDYMASSGSDCGQTNMHEKNYTICFISFSILMTIALIVSTQFRFTYHDQDDSTRSNKKKPNSVKKKENKSDANANEVDGPNIRYKSTEPLVIDGVWMKPKTDQISKLDNSSKFVTVLKRLANLHYALFLFVIWWFGFGMGLIFGFLFWHLQDLGGSSSIFGIAGVINLSSEIVAYFYTTDLINTIGHVKVLYVGLLANVGRFLYVSWLKDAWFVLPFEVVQGITHAAVWAAATSYIAQITPPSLRSSAQGILQGLHYGLGRACGALLGGVIITHVGSEYVFRGYGFACGLIAIVFFTVNRILGVETSPSAAGSLENVENEEAPGGISMDTLYSTTETGLANAAGVGAKYGSVDWDQAGRKVLK